MKNALALVLLALTCGGCHFMPWYRPHIPRGPRRLVVAPPAVAPVVRPPIVAPVVVPPVVVAPAVARPRYYHPFYWRYRPTVVAPARRDVVVAPYVAPQSIGMRFGEPTNGAPEEIHGAWVIDPAHSAAILRAWLTHLMQSYGSTEVPDVSELETSLRENDARLAIAADGTYEMSMRDPEKSERVTWQGKWTFVDGVLALDHSTDVDGVPLESDQAFRFHYYRNDRFTGLVVVDHGIGLVMARG